MTPDFHASKRAFMRAGGILQGRLFTIALQPNITQKDAPLNWRRNAWSRLDRWLWPKGALGFREKKHNYTITAQLFDEFWQSTKPGDPKDTMRDQVANSLRSSQERMLQVIRAAFPLQQHELSPAEPGITGDRGSVADYLKAIEPYSDTAGHPAERDAQDVEKKYRHAFSNFGTNTDSPLSLLYKSGTLGRDKRRLCAHGGHEVRSRVSAWRSRLGRGPARSVGFALRLPAMRQ